MQRRARRVGLGFLIGVVCMKRETDLRHRIDCADSLALGPCFLVSGQSRSTAVLLIVSVGESSRSVNLADVRPVKRADELDDVANGELVSLFDDYVLEWDQVSLTAEAPV